MRGDELLEVLAPDLFLALGDHDDVAREGLSRREMGLERLDVQEELALVVHGATRVDASLAHRRLERR